MNLAWPSPWPQWRSHWHVPHAWPPLAQWLLLLVLGLVVTLAVTAYGSQEAWQAWWDGQEEFEQLEQDLQATQQQAQALRQRIKALSELPHPSGWDVPAWQAWPQSAPTPDIQALQQWLSWGREHGLASQALPLTNAHAVRWTGSLAAQLAAWHGLPQAFPRMRVTAFEWQRVVGKSSLQLVLGWAQANDKPSSDKTVKPKPSDEKSPQLWPPLTTVDAFIPPKGQAHALYNAFHVSALRSGLAPQLLAQRPQGWPQLQHHDMSQLRWVGSLQRLGQRQALFAFNGLVYPVHLGDSLGQDWGQVVQIERDHVVLREWHADTQGQWQPMDRRLPTALERK